MEMSLGSGVDVSQLVQHPVLAALPPFFLRASERYQVHTSTRVNIGTCYNCIGVFPKVVTRGQLRNNLINRYGLP